MRAAPPSSQAPTQLGQEPKYAGEPKAALVRAKAEANRYYYTQRADEA